MEKINWSAVSAYLSDAQDYLFDNCTKEFLSLESELIYKFIQSIIDVVDKFNSNV